MRMILEVWKLDVRMMEEGEMMMIFLVIVGRGFSLI